MKNYTLEELFCEWQKATPEDRAEAMSLLRGEGNAVENCSQLDKIYRIKDAAQKLGGHAITVHCGTWTVSDYATFALPADAILRVR